jgi:saccharopine dehydrogenase-like NADP-dependent oxidoreductase
MKHLVLFGAGRSATVLIDYLKQTATEIVCRVTVADADLENVQQKVGVHPLVKAAQVNIENEAQRRKLVSEADVVISLLPPDLHYFIALDCVEFGKHLLTASYIDDRIRGLEQQINEKGLFFLCEMGLDPGIDHMSAMQLIHSIKAKGGTITSFKSHCGGLVAPESDTNPWHYKISWNARNVITAGKAGALYRENKNLVSLGYTQLFDPNRVVEVNESMYAYYPNRDSLKYIATYNLEEAETFVRTTLRHPEFCFGWKNVIDLMLTDEEKVYETDGLTLADFFRRHFEKYGFGEWLSQMLVSRLSYAKDMMEKLMALIEAEEQAEKQGAEPPEEVMLVDEKGELSSVEVDDIKDKAAETVAVKMHEANLSMRQLFFLGMDDETTVINKGLCSAADVLQFIFETKLALQPEDKDMVVMMHEIDYRLGGNSNSVKSYLSVIGENALHTAMAKTVGLPLGIAAKLILDEKIKLAGLHIPIIAAIYAPVLKELEQHGITFSETHKGMETADE